MKYFIDPVAIAHAQGIRAGRSLDGTPFDCPWPMQNYEAVRAWFAGYSVGALLDSCGSVENVQGYTTSNTAKSKGLHADVMDKIAASGSSTRE
ncbi:hypothetical protein [Sphingomonas faeni]|uniref:hypothetical protein n=1 Tax=Sphingomonas faeni TaxID=185950 RepID=UPI00335132A8